MFLGLWLRCVAHLLNLEAWLANKISVYPLDILFPSLIGKFCQAVNSEDRKSAVGTQQVMSVLKKHIQVTVDEDMEAPDEITNDAAACLWGEVHFL